MKLVGIPNGVKPTAKTDLGMAIFMPAGEGVWYCAVPVGNTCEPGAYTVAVTAGEQSWEETVSVRLFDFPKQNLEIDLTDPEITEANSPAAYEQYRAKIPPLFNTYDEEIYWDGLFLRPVEGGWISTEFGSIRITNGDPATARSHWGMDFAVAEGTPVAAPNGGRVVLAEYLLNTGWTIVIEHGGGLKSYYFHMSEITVAVDERVETGALIGKVGSTGYSTGAHLHFEMRIGNQAISPSRLFEESAGLYAALGIDS
jgi:murein DD-endopeptidase MepM/ murein hydrolase activator NlpD